MPSRVAIRLRNVVHRHVRPALWRLAGHAYGDSRVPPFPADATADVRDRVLVVITAHRHVRRLHTLAESMRQFDAGYAHDRLVVHAGGRRDIPDAARRLGMAVLERDDAFQDRGDLNAAFTQHPDYRYYLCLDDDTYIVRPSWLAAFVGILNGDDHAGAVGNHYVRMADYRAAGHGPYEARLRAVLHAAGCLRHPDDSVDFLESAALLLPRAVLCAVGTWRLFEPGDRFATLLSEVEFSVRLRQAGYQLLALPEVVVGHKNHRFASLPDAALQRLTRYKAEHDV